MKFTITLNQLLLLVVGIMIGMNAPVWYLANDRSADEAAKTITGVIETLLLLAGGGWAIHSRQEPQPIDTESMEFKAGVEHGRNEQKNQKQ